MTKERDNLDFTAGAVTLCDVLRRRGERQEGWRGYTFLLDGEAEEAGLTYGELDRRARAVAARLQALGAQGERVLLLYPPGLEYVTAVFGCFYAGAVPILAFPPRLNRPTPRVQAIVADARPKIAMTVASIFSTLKDRFTHVPDLAFLEWLASDAVSESEAEGWREPKLTADSLAFLQYTSGSTGTPKGVVVSHGNVMHNLELLRYGFDIVQGRDRSALWLPIYHDMGLVGGILEAVYSGMAATLMSPAAFLQRPVRWLQAITRYRTTISGGPNFAYQLCVDQVTPEQRETLDLSSWRSAFCGAEPIHAETLERFAETFAPCGFDRRALYPCYGMAETTLIVSGGPVGGGAVVQAVEKSGLEQGRIVDAEASEDGHKLVGSGQVLPDLDIVIVDPETRTRCAPGQVGEIWIAGPSVAQGYWNRPEETRETFQAHLDTGEGPFLRTGDLGYLQDAELFVTGRCKDLIIIRGQNHYPQDIERTVEASHAALRPGCGAAFSVDVAGEERLVVVQEVRREHRRADSEEIFSAIRTAVAEQHDLAVHAVTLLQPASIPKTSSGKIRRSACRADYLSEDLKVVAEWRRDTAGGGAPHRAAEETPAAFTTVLSPAAQELASWVVARLAERLGIDPREIDLREPFARYGLDSARAMSLAGDLEVHLGRRLEPTLLYEHPTVEALVRHLVDGDEGPAPAAFREGGAAGEPIAILGIGCRFPGADGPEAFWKLLREGVDAISEVPAERWDLARFYDPDPEALGKISTRWGGFLEQVDEFDLHFFGLTQREAARTDPQQRLLLETAWEALEDAGQVPERLAGSRTGVFVGISTNDYGRLQFSDPELIDIYGSTGNAFSIAANRLSYTFDFRGPSIAVDTACSSSLVAVHLACSSLEQGECDVALAAGVNVILSPAIAMSYTKAGAMARDGRCKAFDAAADGFVRGEGAGCVVLKPLSRALADGDPIYAVIRGSAVNQDGRTNGLMAPSRQAQEAVLREAYARAGVQPGEVQYVEAHGTGTLLGDPIEARALGAVLAEGRPAERPCALGSVKTNVGHLEAAAGIAGLIKTALALSHREIPPSLHFHEPNPHIPFAELPLAVQRELGPWPVSEGPARAGISAFGFGGTNAHVVLEGAPARSAERLDDGLPHLLTLSARSTEALASRARALRDRDEIGPLSDLCHTAGARRAHYDHRMALVGRTHEDLLDGLAAFLNGEPRPGLATGRASGAKPPVAFVYSGQGSQWWGMGRELLTAEPVFRAALEEVDGLLSRHVDFSLLHELTVDEERSRLAETEVAQPALFGVQVALTALWRHWGVEPDGVMGHSSGEVAAAYVAGALTLEEAARWIVERGKRLQGAMGHGRMAMVSLPADEARAALAGYEDRLSIAALNSPTSTVLAGDAAALEEVLATLKARDVFCRELRVNYAFHSPQVEPFLDGIEEALAGLAPKAPSLPLVSTVTGRTVTGRDFNGSYWRDQIRQPVRFAEAVEAWLERGYRTFVEIGPHPVLTADLGECLRQRGERGTVLASLRRAEGERASLLASLGALYVQGQPVAWDRVEPDGRCVPLPSYPWQRERCWLEVTGDGMGWDRPGAGRDGGAFHPLLGQLLSVAHLGEERVWDNELTVRRLPYLKDHRVEGAVVLPATAYLDMALSAADAAGVEISGLAEVRFRSPLLLPDDGSRHVQAIFSAESGEEATFRIFSQAAGEGDLPWTLHALGKVVLGTNGNGYNGNGNGSGLPVSGGGLAEIRQRCHEEMAAEDYYTDMHGRGLQYGPAFQGITKLWRGRGEALGQVEVPAALESDLGSYQIHPAILDACGQVMIAAEGDRVVGGGRSFLPMEIGELKVHGKPGLRMWSHAQLRDFGAPGAEALVGDARLLDEDGQVVIEALGLRLRYLDSKARRAEPGPEDWLYELRWQPAEGEAAANVPVDGSWMIFADSTGVAETLAGKLAEGGGRPVRVVPGAAYQKVGEDDFQIRPGEIEDVKRLFADVVTVGTTLRGVVHLWTLDEASREVTSGSLQSGELRGCGTVLPLVRELAGRPWNELPRLWVATRGAQPVSEDNDKLMPVELSQATLWGLGRTIGQEQPGVWGGLVDFEAGAAAADDAGRLFTRLARSDGETQVAFRGERLHVARITRARHLARAAGTAGGTMRWRPDASYLVTGGLGGLGLEVARWMVSQGARRLVLLGRTQLPPRSGWSEIDPSSRLYRQIAAIRELEALGASVHLASVDVADEAQVAGFLESFRREGWPAIRGVVHAAGVLQDQTILELDARAMDAVFRAKVLGAWLLHRLLGESPLDFFVLFSSAASLLGSAGQANYAAANGFLDALAHHRRALGQPALAINWGPWAEVGMAAETAQRGQRLALRGIGSIQPELGLEVLEWLMRGESSQVGVLPIRWAQLFQVMPQTRNSPLLSGLVREAEEEEDVDSAVAARRREIRELLRAAPPAELSSMLEGLISEQVAGVVGLPASRLDVNAPLNTLGIDSLLAVELKTRVENEMGVIVPAVKLLEGPSIADLAAVVRDQVSTDRSVLSRADAKSAGRVPVTPIQPRGTRPPFLCVHPGALDVHCYDELARALGEDQPFFALQPPELDNYRSLGGFEDGAAGEKPLEEIAAACVEAIRALQPHGPYHLGGWSMGGVLAFLAAQQLEQEGEEIALLAVFDSPAPPKGEQSVEHDDLELVKVFTSFLGARRGQELPISPAEYEGLDFDARLALLLERAKEARVIPPDSGQSQIRFLFQVFKNGLLAAVRQLGQCRPPVYPRAVTLFRVGEVLDAFDQIFPDVTSQWSHFTAEPLKVHDVPGDHYSMFRHPNVEVLAAGLREELAAAQAAWREVREEAAG